MLLTFGTNAQGSMVLVPVSVPGGRSQWFRFPVPVRFLGYPGINNLSFLVLFLGEFLFCFFSNMSFFFERFPFISQDFGVSVGIKNAFFFVRFLAFLQHKIVFVFV